MQTSIGTLHRLVHAKRAIWGDFAAGIFSVARKAIALVGVASLALMLTMVVRPDLRDNVLASLTDWNAPSAELAASDVQQESDNPVATSATNTVAPGHELDMSARRGVASLSREQHAAAMFLARKYRLAPDAIAYVVTEAFSAGKEFKVDPLLILAVMSIESSMNPFAQSTVGAQGLMQVMTSVHADRFDEFGGAHAALNPTANIRVGTEILKELIDQQGSVEAGLKAYVGASLHPDDGGYGSRVLVERARLESAVTGRPVTLPPSVQQAGDEGRPAMLPVSYATGTATAVPRTPATTRASVAGGA